MFGVLAGSCNFIQFFFFQAEDSIRDKLVTAVQTCALPISPLLRGIEKGIHASCSSSSLVLECVCRGRDTSTRTSTNRTYWLRKCGSRVRSPHLTRTIRSEERRVGREGRSRRWPEDVQERRV